MAGDSITGAEGEGGGESCRGNKKRESASQAEVKNRINRGGWFARKTLPLPRKLRRPGETWPDHGIVTTTPSARLRVIKADTGCDTVV